MNSVKYMREGRGLCKKCARELDVVVETYPWKGTAWDANRAKRPEPVISRHLNRIEEYGPRGAVPGGFCPGSLTEPDPVRTPEPMRGKKRS